MAGSRIVSCPECSAKLKVATPLAKGKKVEKMKVPAPLFAINFTEPGQTLGYRMDSFVHVDGHFRILGRLRALGK